MSQTVCKLAVTPIYLGRLLVCDNIIRESWLKDAKSLIPTNEPINATTDEGSCVLLPVTLLCVEALAMAPAWAAHHLDSWGVKEQCAFAVSTVLLSLHNRSETSHWPIVLNLLSCLTWELPAGVYDPRFASAGKATFLPPSE